MNKVSIKMNKALSLLLVLIIISLCVVCGNNVTVQAQDETPVIFPDPNLEAAIRQRINKSEGPIYTHDLEGLLILVALGRDISDLTGLEYCVNLKQLYLQINPICDLSPLASLPNLTNLGFDRNGFSDLSRLPSLPNLTQLDLRYNQISDLSLLPSLTNLNELLLGGNNLSDLSLLSSLPNLTDLYLDRNGISDLSSLANLPNLTNLDLHDNQISDISTLSFLPKLVKLNLNGNHISDFSPLSSLPNLTDLYLDRNGLSDLSSLASFTNLTSLNLKNNQISDLSPLTNLSNLYYLNLEANNISDISPLVENSGLSKRDTVILKDNPLSPESENVYVPQLKRRGVSIPRPKTSLGYLNIGHLLIPLFVLVAALVAVLLGYPTQHQQRRRLRRKWLVAGVIVAGLYTFCALVAVAAGGMQPIHLEDLLLFVVAPGLFLYGGVAVAWFLWSTRERKQQHKEEPE